MADRAGNASPRAERATQSGSPFGVLEGDRLVLVEAEGAGEHDDLAIALALARWRGQRVRRRAAAGLESEFSYTQSL